MPSTVETALPARTPDAEDAFVAAWQAADDPEPLAAVISEALAARRPQLAARLVTLLPDDGDDPAHPTLDRARAAARLLLVATPDPQAAADLDAAWQGARDAWMKRARTRMRRRSRARHGQAFGVAPSSSGRGRGPRRS